MPLPISPSSRQTSSAECLISLRIASVLILLRAIETVSVGTQRAFEQYRGTVQISTAVRLLTLASAAVLALLGQGTISILLATGVFLALGAYLQFRQLRSFWRRFLWPLFQSERNASFAWARHLRLAAGVGGSRLRTV